jgi:hypothetical protein
MALNFMQDEIKNLQTIRVLNTIHSLAANVASVIKLNQTIAILNRRVISGRKTEVSLG